MEVDDKLTSNGRIKRADVTAPGSIMKRIARRTCSDLEYGKEMANCKRFESIHSLPALMSFVVNGDVILVGSCHCQAVPAKQQ
jgi:hypothetical protein